MPRVSTYRLAWLPAIKAYELYQTHDQRALNILPESPEWFAWLDQVSSFTFEGKSGHYTARKETRQRGDRYWSAYLATGKHLSKKYLGKTAHLSLAHLEQVAGALKAEQITSRLSGQEPPLLLPLASEARIPPSESLALTNTDTQVESTHRPPSAQRDTLLATKLHMPRPRTQLVPRAHLVDRLQQSLANKLT